MNITSRGLDFFSAKKKRIFFASKTLTFLFSYICNMPEKLSKFFMNLLRKFMNSFQKIKGIMSQKRRIISPFNKIKTDKTNIFKNIPVYNHLRNISVFALFNTNTTSKQKTRTTPVNHMTNFSNTNLYYANIIDYILSLNPGVETNLSESSALSILNREIDNLNAEIVSLSGRINTQLSA